MKSPERMKAALNGDTVDRAPVIPAVIGHAIRIVGGMTQREYSTSAEKLVAAQLGCWEHYGYDGIYIGIDNVTIAETGADCIEVDSPVDLSLAREQVDCCLRGNVSTSLLASGSAEGVYRAASDCLCATGGRKFILADGCELPRDTPEQNVRVLLRAAEDSGARRDG